MKYITPRDPAIETLALGAVGQTKTYTIYGNAVFENNTDSITITGVADVDVTIYANHSAAATFVEVFEGVRRVETFCVLCVESQRWTSSALLGLGHHIAVSSGLCFINLGTGAETDFSEPPTSLDPWLNYVLVADSAAKCWWAVRANTTLTQPEIGLRIPQAAAPVAIGIARSASDRRTHISVDAEGNVSYHDHDFQALPKSQNIGPILSGAFRYENSTPVEFVYVTSTFDLCSRPVNSPNTASRSLGAQTVIEKHKRWMRLQSAADVTGSVYCVTDADSGNGFLWNGSALTPFHSSEAYAGYGVNGTEIVPVCWSSGTVAHPQSGNVTSTFPSVLAGMQYPASANQFFTNGQRYESGSLTGTLPEGRTLIGVLTLSGVAFAICSKATAPALRTDSANHTVSIAVESKEFIGDFLHLDLMVTGAADTLFEIGLPDGVHATSTVDGSAVIAAPAGLLHVVIDMRTLKDNTFTLAVGRNAILDTVMPDELPDEFVIENIYGLDTGDSRATVSVTPVGYDTPTSVHSNGRIFIDGVEVPDGSPISPNQSLSITVEQSSKFVDSWWVTVGELRVTFVSVQQDQPVTVKAKGRAYTPIGKFVSRPIENTYGVPVLLQLGELGSFQNLDAGVRQIVVAAGDNARIEFEVTEHTRYALPYVFGRTSHFLDVWADAEFLDTEPVTPEAQRHVRAVSPPFSFAAIPEGFYAVATTPAGVLVSLDGEQLIAETDARDYNHAEALLEFDLDQPLTYTAIPFADGRTLDFGDVVARWQYGPIIDEVVRERQQLIKQAPKFIAVLDAADKLADSRPVAPVEPLMFTLYPLRKHQTFSSSASNERDSYQTQSLQSPVNSGVEIGEPVLAASNTCEVESLKASAVVFEARTFAELDFDIAVPSISIEIQNERMPEVVQTVPSTVESFNFSYKIHVDTETADVGYVKNDGNATSGGRPLDAAKVEASTHIGLEVVPISVTDAGTKPVDKLDVNVAVIRVPEALEVESQSATGKASDLVEVKPDFIPDSVLTDWGAKPISASDRRPETIPIRALYGQTEKREVTIEARQVIASINREMTDPIPGVSFHGSYVRNSYFAPSQHAGVSQALGIDTDSVFSASTLLVEIPLLPQFALTPVNSAFEPKKFERVDFNFNTRVGYEAEHPFEMQVSGQFSNAGSAYYEFNPLSREGRKIVHPLAATFDGNPDLLDRGYFASEVEALQNAVNVWLKEPSSIVARQIPSGQWYWATPDVCVNMCEACPPYGYISGG